MRFIVFGAGGVGGCIGAGLREANHDVVLIARGAHREAMQRSGLSIISPAGVRKVDIPVVEAPSEIDWQHDDVVLLTMKGQHTHDALRALVKVNPQARVVCAQNGVANERMAASMFSGVVGMVVNLPAMHLRPGEVITHAVGRGGVLDCGLFPTGVDELVVSLCVALEDGGFSARPDTNVMRWKYGKLLTNLVNTAQALLGEHEEIANIARAARREAVACYAAHGIECATVEEIRTRQEDTYRMGEIPGTPRSGGSTWQSLARETGNSESDFLNGEIERLGAQAGLATPVNSGLVRAMHEALEEGVAAGSFPLQRLLTMVGL